MYVAALLVTSFSFGKLAIATAGVPALLYNTYENTAHACVSDCQKAVKQVCAGSLSKPIEVLAGHPPAVFLEATVGGCIVRYYNANYNETGFTTADQCTSHFADLISQTSSAKDTSCHQRIGGITGNDANGIPTGDPVYVYMPVDTPSDGFEASLDGVPSQGRAAEANELYGVSQSRCGKSPVGVVPIPEASSGFSSRDIAPSVRDMALYNRNDASVGVACGAIGVGAALWGACAYMLVVGLTITLGPLGMIGAPWCMSFAAWGAGIATAGCVYEAVYFDDDDNNNDNNEYSSNDTPSKTPTIDPSTATSSAAANNHVASSSSSPGATPSTSSASNNTASNGGNGRRVRVREATSSSPFSSDLLNADHLDRRLVTGSSDAAYCNITTLRTFKGVDLCVVDAVAKKCGIAQV